MGVGRVRSAIVVGLFLAWIDPGWTSGQDVQERPVPATPGAYRSAVLGIEYRLIPHQGRFLAELTREPESGSPASRIRYPDGRVTNLETGDRIVSLDDLGIGGPNDLDNHVGLTTGTFVDVRTGAFGVFTTVLPGGTFHRADNLGIDYQLVPYRGHLAAQLVAEPTPGSPATRIRYPDGRVTNLETGDRIVSLDGQLIDAPQHVLNHVGLTTGEFVNIRGGAVTPFTTMLGATVAPTVDVLLAIDTNARAAGGGSLHTERDGENMRDLFRTVGARTTMLTSDAVGPENILHHYRTLPDDPSRVLVFYYSGHGHIAEPDGRQILDCNNGRRPIYRDTVLNAMRSRPRRLVVILHDCCSNVGPPIMAAPRAPGEPRPELILRDLLFRHRGTVVIASSRRGQTSGCNAGMGGFFTFNFASTLRDAFDGAPTAGLDVAPADGLVTWNELFTRVRNETANLTRGKQVPEAFSLGQPIR